MNLPTSTIAKVPLSLSADVVTLTLTHSQSPWRLPAGFNCSEYFYLNVRDGSDPNAPVLGHYCTNAVPPSITSSVSLSSALLIVSFISLYLFPLSVL